jgi:hypothetical protein
MELVLSLLEQARREVDFGTSFGRRFSLAQNTIAVDG